VLDSRRRVNQTFGGFVESKESDRVETQS